MKTNPDQDRLVEDGGNPNCGIDRPTHPRPTLFPIVMLMIKTTLAGDLFDHFQMYLFNNCCSSNFLFPNPNHHPDNPQSSPSAPFFDDHHYVAGWSNDDDDDHDHHHYVAGWSHGGWQKVREQEARGWNLGSASVSMLYQFQYLPVSSSRVQNGTFTAPCFVVGGKFPGVKLIWTKAKL